MSITDKTRKNLWGRSGNCCAMCRAELVAERNEHNRNLNIGDECHIISRQTNGPRHSSNYEKDYDDYENLILLCKNHHKTIDELWETYTVELLKTIKSNHEKWIRTIIDNAKKDKKSDKLKFLPRITSGKDIVNIICEAHGYVFDHINITNQNDADFISSFLQNIQDWGELTGFGDFEIGRKVQLGFDLNKEIEELENRGFYLFGERKKKRFTNANKDDFGLLDIATIIVVNKDNLAIVNKEKLATTE